MLKSHIIRKTTYREIKSSFGRFFAIFAIVALGVGFFAGLKVTKSAMTAVVKDYLDSHGFYDLRLLSTYGFEQEDVDGLSGEQDVEAAAGGLSFDILYRTEDGRQGAVKTYSLTDGVNEVRLMAGRLPAGPDECVADSDMFGEEALGSLLYLSEENEEEDLEHFAYREYRIVGIVQSPLYIQYERGNTSLGNGRLNGFVYLTREGYDAEYYTEIYVRFRQNNGLYSDGYKDLIDRKTKIWEDLTARAADRRFREIYDEAEREIADAEAELADKRAEGEKELADAEKKIADAREELEDAEKELGDAEREAADGEREIADAEKEIADNEKTLSEKEAELADARRTLEDKEREAEDAGWQLESGERSYADGRNKLDEARRVCQNGEAALNAAKSEIEDGKRQIEAGRGALASAEAQLRAALAAGLLSSQEFDVRMAVIQAEEQKLAAQEEQLKAAEAQVSRSEAELAAARAEIDSGERELAESRGELDRGWRELDEGMAALQDARAELEDGERQIREGWQELADARKELLKAREELEEGRKEIEDGRVRLEEARTELADGEREYEDALREFQEKTGEAEEKIADAREELEKLEEPDTYVLGRDTNIGYVCFESDSDIVEGIANIFPVFFFLVAALVCITTMNRMVEEQRTQIGVLKALGYGETTIMSKYMAYSGLAAAAGCVFGFFLGTWGFPKVIWYAYGIMYSVDDIGYVFDWKLAAVSFAVSMLCSMGTTWLSCRRELSAQAAALMRPKAPEAGKRIFLEYIPFLWKRLGFLRKVSLRNIFRYRKRLIMMVTGIGGCTALLVTGFGIRDSIADVAERQFQEIQTYDVGVSLNDPADEELTDWLESHAGEYGIEAWTAVMEKSLDLVTAGAVKSVYLVTGTAVSMPEFLNLHTADGAKISYPGVGEAVISDKLSEEYGIGKGDTITLRDEDMRTLTVTVSAVYENYIYNYVHVSEETWRQVFGEEPGRKTLYVNLAENADAHALSAAMMGLEQVMNVTVNADTMERIGNMMKSLNIIVVVVVFCAAGLAFIVLYNLTNINITERIREIATIKVLGFYKQETASYVFRENVLLTVLGAVLGLFLGYFLHRFVMAQIKVDLISFHVCVKPVSYGYSVILTLAFAFLVDRVMGGKLERISMTESLKSVD